MNGALKTLFNRTLNSVWFGIAMMLLVAGYVAVGSGFPRVREYFEMDELAFFNAWPLKVLMGLLVASLVTVTFVRIPFTVPRYGVWMIHTGIVTLIWGMAYYYSHKEEGRAFIVKGQSATEYYDNWERALYVRAEGMNTGDVLQLPSLPRFKSYPTLEDSRLKDMQAVIITKAETGERQVAALGRMLGTENISFDVTGYWPYAVINTGYEKKEGEKQSGMKVVVSGPGGEVMQSMWVVGDGLGHGDQHVGPLELEHRGVETEEAANQLLAGAGRVHQLEVNGTQLVVEVGKSYEVGGYKIEVEAFDPQWTTMQRETVELLTLKVTPPADSAMKGEVFKRQVIPGREKVTDWKLGEADSGPMGKRMSEPLDGKLITRYTFNDSLKVLPHSSGATKQLMVTTPTRTLLLTTSLTGPATMTEWKDGKGEIVFGGGAKVAAERVDGIVRREWVEEVPKEKRERNFGEQGLGQVVGVRVRVGSWDKLVFAPYQQWAVSNRWEGGEVVLPGGRRLQLGLGHRIRPIAPDMKTGKETSVRLDAFDIKSYDGGSVTSGMQRDFISTLTITQPDGKSRTGKAHMNSPIYFGGTPMFNLGDTYWTLFQAQWDPNGQRFTVLGVGNRPGVWVMTGGSVLLTIGLLYAFYAKPLIINARKRRAIAEAEAKGKLPPGGAGGKVRKPVVMEGVEGRVSV